jgi:hypothetical protein
LPRSRAEDRERDAIDQGDIVLSQFEQFGDLDVFGRRCLGPTHNFETLGQDRDAASVQSLGLFVPTLAQFLHLVATEIEIRRQHRGRPRPVGRKTGPAETEFVRSTLCRRICKTSRAGTISWARTIAESAEAIIDRRVAAETIEHLAALDIVAFEILAWGPITAGDDRPGSIK